MNKKILAMNDSFQSRCTKCRKITSHTVISITEEHQPEAQCHTCNHVSAAKKPVANRILDPHKSEREEWASLQPDMDANQAKAYSVTGSYRARSLVNHPTFGLGLVKRVTWPHKMTVLFADGQKIMRCH